MRIVTFDVMIVVEYLEQMQTYAVRLMWSLYRWRYRAQCWWPWTHHAESNYSDTGHWWDSATSHSSTSISSLLLQTDLCTVQSASITSVHPPHLPTPCRFRLTGPSVGPQLTSCSPPSAALLAATGTSVSSALVCVPPCLILTLFSSVTSGSCLYPVPFSLSCSVSPDSLSPHSHFPLSPFSAKARGTRTFLTFPFVIYSRSIQILNFWIY